MNVARLEKYFSKSVKDENGCLVYQGAKGRPYVYYEGKTTPLARVVYYLHTGISIPGGYFVCHRCDNHQCINPEHLFLGTPLGNARDREAKGRGAKGSRMGSAKLSEKIVLAIRLYAQKNPNISALAREFKLPYHAVYAAIKGQTWKHVAGGRA